MPPVIVALKNLSLVKNLRYVFAGIFAGICFLLLVSYLVQTNNQAEYGFTLKQLEAKKTQLSEDIRRLTWEAAQARAVANISERARQSGLAAPASVSFLTAVPSVVAVAPKANSSAP